MQYIFIRLYLQLFIFIYVEYWYKIIIIYRDNNLFNYRDEEMILLYYILCGFITRWVRSIDVKGWLLINEETQ